MKTCSSTYFRCCSVCVKVMWAAVVVHKQNRGRSLASSKNCWFFSTTPSSSWSSSYGFEDNYSQFALACYTAKLSQLELNLVIKSMILQYQCGSSLISLIRRGKESLMKYPSTVWLRHTYQRRKCSQISHYDLPDHHMSKLADCLLAIVLLQIP